MISLGFAPSVQRERGRLGLLCVNQLTLYPWRSEGVMTISGDLSRAAAPEVCFCVIAPRLRLMIRCSCNAS